MGNIISGLQAGSEILTGILSCQKKIEITEQKAPKVPIIQLNRNFGRNIFTINKVKEVANRNATGRKMIIYSFILSRNMSQFTKLM
jgi:hypothetical protein